METIKFKKLHKAAQLPTKKDGDIGWDCYVVHDDDGNWAYNGDAWVFNLQPRKGRIFKTGLQVELPHGLNLLLWDRSGLSAVKHVHRLAGVIDSTYRGEIMIALYNLSDKVVTITEGDRIAQGVLQWEVPAVMEWTEELNTTNRGGNGFGSTGK